MKRETKTRIKMTYRQEVFSMPNSLVKHWARHLNLVSVPGLYSNLDVDKGKYEGGFKVWESTHDLVKFITENQDIMNELIHSDEDEQYVPGNEIKTLELGAGASLPSLALLNRLMADQSLKRKYRVHVQDYNWQVLISLTFINFVVNLPSDYLEALITTKWLRFFSGDWKDFRRNSTYKYNLIMMSEVLYDSENYESLHELVDKHLDTNGYIVIATKDTYFGLTGDLYSWLDYLSNRNQFMVVRTIKISATIPRSILIMKRLMTSDREANVDR